MILRDFCFFDLPVIRPSVFSLIIPRVRSLVHNSAAMASIYALPASYLWHICGLGSLIAVILCHGLTHNAFALFARSLSPGTFFFLHFAHLT